MLALIMCLLVLGVAGAVVLRDGLREGTDKGATVPAPSRRARVPKAPRPPRAPRPAAPPRPERRHRPIRSGLLLLVSTAGIGVLTGATLGVLAVILALVLRSVAGDAP